MVYGLGVDPVAVTVEWRPFRETLITDAGLNVLIDLDIDGDVSLCMVKELQRHPIRGNVLHVDFLRVSRDAAITVEVPIVLAGEAREVEMANGTIDQLLHALTMSAKPADIPNEIAVMQFNSAFKELPPAGPSQQITLRGTTAYGFNVPFEEQHLSQIGRAHV